MSFEEKRVLRYTFFPSRIGNIGLAATEEGICRLNLSVDPEEFGAELEARYNCAAVEDGGHFAEIKRDLEDYFERRARGFNCAIDLIEGTDFQRRVWRALLKIPYGQVRSYGWVAREIGRPKAVRAVGGANARNPIAIVIPCHRVVRSDGGLGGYGGGPEVKRELLQIEGVVL
ncbi:MAG: methylated-DNA--[protein]-cysteine S-methyltransferase [bacterium]